MSRNARVRISCSGLQVVPPFSILTQLGSMLSEFLAFFAELASAAITAAVGETTSLVQEAVSLRSFPAKGEAAKLVSSRDMVTGGSGHGIRLSLSSGLLPD